MLIALGCDVSSCDLKVDHYVLQRNCVNTRHFSSSQVTNRARWIQKSYEGHNCHLISITIFSLSLLLQVYWRLWRRTGARPATEHIAGERQTARTTRNDRARTWGEVTPPRPSPKSRWTACKGDGLTHLSPAQLGRCCAHTHAHTAPSPGEPPPLGGCSAPSRGESLLKMWAGYLVTTAGSNFRALDGAAEQDRIRGSLVCGAAASDRRRRIHVETWVHLEVTSDAQHYVTAAPSCTPLRQALRSLMS